MHINRTYFASSFFILLHTEDCNVYKERMVLQVSFSLLMGISSKSSGSVSTEFVFSAMGVLELGLLYSTSAAANSTHYIDY